MKSQDFSLLLPSQRALRNNILLLSPREHELLFSLSLLSPRWYVELPTIIVTYHRPSGQRHSAGLHDGKTNEQYLICARHLERFNVYEVMYIHTRLEMEDEIINDSRRRRRRRFYLNPRWFFFSPLRNNGKRHPLRRNARGENALRDVARARISQPRSYDVFAAIVVKLRSYEGELFAVVEKLEREINYILV